MGNPCTCHEYAILHDSVESISLVILPAQKDFSPSCHFFTPSAIHRVTVSRFGWFLSSELDRKKKKKKKSEVKSQSHCFFIAAARAGNAMNHDEPSCPPAISDLPSSPPTSGQWELLPYAHGRCPLRRQAGSTATHCSSFAPLEHAS